MKHNYSYEYKRIILNPLEKQDIEELRVLRNGAREFFVYQGIITPEKQQKWFEQYLQKDDDIMFKIVKAEEPEEFIGAVALYDIEPEKHQAEFGRIVIDKEKVSEKGLGQETVEAITQFGFTILNLRKIVAEVLKENQRALTSDLRAGFTIIDENEELYFLEIKNEN